MKQKTAVEWLIEELGEYFPHEIGGIHLMVNKAKQMEKEQIMIAFEVGDIQNHIQDAEEYYNQTYSQDRELGKEVTDLLENYKKDKTFKQKSKWISQNAWDK